MYKSTDEKHVGIYGVLCPILLVREPELIQSILVKDFSHFTDRGMHCDESYDPLSAHLGAIRGSKWKNMRVQLTPTFTSGKLKAMFSTILDCGLRLENHVRTLSEKAELLVVREVAASYTTSVITSVGFGVEVGSIYDPNNEFRVCGRRIFSSFGFLLSFMAPKLMKFFRIKLVDSWVENFLMSVVKENLEYREKNNVSRKDFFQLLIQLRNTGAVQSDNEWETVIKADENKKLLTLNEMCAQSFIFFAAGFESSSSTFAFCLYELAKNQDIQRRVHDEIDRVLKQHDGQITYESIADMKFLDACIYETLRKYPVVPFLTRTCVKDYQIPGSNQIIEKGVDVFIPALGLQMDEKYYDHPKIFNPDRFGESFTGKNTLNRPYIPFGDGPRNCLGMKLGKLETKVGLIMMLKGFRFELEEKLKNSEPTCDPRCFFIAPLEQIQLHIFKRLNQMPV